MNRIRGLLIICFVLLAYCSYSQLVINELLASNGDDDDWIELYNSSSTTINYEGYFLSDDPNKPQKFRFSSSIYHTIGPGAFKRYYANGDESGLLNLNFKLNSNGETLILSDSNGDLLDSVSFDNTIDQISWGRCTNGGGSWGYLTIPSPQASNLNSSCFESITETPEPSVSGGFYNTSITVAICTSNPDDTIRYTLDGSEPNINSAIFQSPIIIDDRNGDPNVYSEIQTNISPPAWIPEWQAPAGEVFKATVLRAKAWNSANIPSKILTQTYFVDDSIDFRYTSLPIISLVSDPRNFFNDTVGIYVPGVTWDGSYGSGNYFMDWERPVHLEFYENHDSLGFFGNYGIKIQGYASQASPQKGVHIIAKGKYGEDRIQYPLFKNGRTKARKLNTFKRFLIRSWGSARGEELFLDAYNQLLLSKVDLDIQDYRPAIVFINGEYWGLQEVREANKNSWYYQYHYNIDRVEPGFDMLVGFNEYLQIDEGENDHWNDMNAFIINNDMSLEVNYDSVRTLMEIENFITYIVHCVYLYKADWPENNHFMWRPRTGRGKWRWSQYDMEIGLGQGYGGPSYDMFPQLLQTSGFWGPYPILISLLENPEFHDLFINRFADFMNSYFKIGVMHNQLDSMKGQLVEYLPEYQDRWQLNYEWDTFMTNLHENIDLRHSYMLQHMVSHFSLSDTFTIHLNVSNEDHGTIQINSLTLNNSLPSVTTETFPWQGFYFKDVPIKLWPFPKPGYRFSHWEGITGGAGLIVNLLSDTTFKAIFEPDEIRSGLFINEFMTSGNSSYSDEYGESDDWIEIYNSNSYDVDLGGLFITDNEEKLFKHYFPLSYDHEMLIPADSFLILWADKSESQGPYHLGFSLSSEGETIQLVQLVEDDTIIIDQFQYHTQSPNLSFGCFPDASSYHTWLSPTPGGSNLISEIDQIETPVSIEIYPNPSTGLVYIKGSSDAQIEVSDMAGRILCHSMRSDRIDLSNFNDGIYLLIITTRKKQFFRKIVKQ
jgi:hypothetical protein